MKKARCDGAMPLKILFTTRFLSSRPSYRPDADLRDACSVESRKFFRTRNPPLSPGLRFLKQNIPQIEILEYPTWGEYCKKLEEGWDVVGFSFYLFETNEVLQMIAEARRQGVREIWGGNYGVLTPEIRKYFDRIFIGYAEEDVAKALGVELGEIRHPILMSDWGVPYIPLKTKVAHVFTSRGCNIGCNFCQTPSFCPRISFVSLPSIGRALECYEEMGMKRVSIQSENFGIPREYSERVVDTLDEHGFEWECQTRPDILDGKVERWRKKGLQICAIGVESFSQKNLDYVNTRKNPSKILEVIRELNDNGVKIYGFFIIGYPSQSESDVEREVEMLASLDLNSYRITILTPFPQTPLWDMLSKYGPFDPDYSKYDCTNLVWNHPKISRGRMRELLLESHEKVHPRGKYLRNLLGSFKTVISRRHPIYFGW